MKPVAFVARGMQIVGTLQQNLCAGRASRGFEISRFMNFRSKGVRQLRYCGPNSAKTYIIRGMMILGLPRERINDPGNWEIMYPTFNGEHDAKKNRKNKRLGQHLLPSIIDYIRLKLV